MADKSASGMSKVEFGNNVPGWATGASNLPAIIVLQVSADSAPVNRCSLAPQ